MSFENEEMTLLTSAKGKVKEAAASSVVNHLFPILIIFEWIPNAIQTHSCHICFSIDILKDGLFCVYVDDICYDTHTVSDCDIEQWKCEAIASCGVYTFYVIYSNKKLR